MKGEHIDVFLELYQRLSQLIFSSLSIALVIIEKGILICFRGVFLPGVLSVFPTYSHRYAHTRAHIHELTLIPCVWETAGTNISCLLHCSHWIISSETWIFPSLPCFCPQLEHFVTAQIFLSHSLLLQEAVISWWSGIL